MATCTSIGAPKDSRAKSQCRRDNYDSTMISAARRWRDGSLESVIQKTGRRVLRIAEDFGLLLMGPILGANLANQPAHMRRPRRAVRNFRGRFFSGGRA